jgi:uncharacterized protein (DUF1800 family)
MSPRFYDPRVHAAKVKTPFELVTSALRATQLDVQRPRALMETLRALGHLPYNESAPTGYSAASEKWVNSGALLARMNFALELAANRAAELPEGTPETIVAQLIPGIPPDELTEAIHADRARGGGSARVFGLALGSPEFQRR